MVGLSAIPPIMEVLRFAANCFIDPCYLKADFTFYRPLCRDKTKCYEKAWFALGFFAGLSHYIYTTLYLYTTNVNSQNAREQ